MDFVVKEVGRYWWVDFDEAFILWVNEVFFLGVFYQDGLYFRGGVEIFCSVLLNI